MFGIKKKLHRDRATELFVAHGYEEARRFRDRLLGHFAEFCTGLDDQPALETIRNKAWMIYRDGKFISTEKTFLDAHCIAIVFVAGLEALRVHFPRGWEYDVITNRVHRQIVGDEVGHKNIGHAPNPWPTPEMHVLHRPGNLTGGIPSPQQQLLRTYEKFKTIPERLALLLLSLKIINSPDGVMRALYRQEKHPAGIMARYQIGYQKIDPKHIDRWEDDFQITDPGAVVSLLHPPTAEGLIRELNGIDTFWPTLAKKYRLTWK